MRSTTSRLASGAALAVLVLSAGEARPCGGAFGYEYTLSPSQNIVVGYRDGIETYVFNPYFCGNGSDFGLILPIPGVLSHNPALYEKRLYSDLEALAAPTIETTEICSSSYQGPGRGTPPGTGGTGSTGGTDVIQRGTVGVFDYALLHAESTESFTDWLDANGFPYEESAEAVFEHYVENNWYFVAFKVMAGAGTNGTGGNGSGAAGGGSGGALSPTMCGDFGPISLSFPVEPNPVIPARIAAVSSSSLTWIVYTLAEHQLRVQDLGTELRFSGTITQADLAQRAEVAKVADAGARLTERVVSITKFDSDLVLEPDPAEADYRRVERRTLYVLCTGGSAGTGGAGTGGSLAGGIGGASLSTGGQPPTTGGQSSEQAGSSSADAPIAGGTTSIDTGGVTETGGAPKTPTGGGMNTGGARTTTGATGGATGGAPEATGGAEVFAAAAGADTGTTGSAMGNDDEGDCSCRSGRSRTSHNPRALLFAAFALALAAGRRRQRHTA